MKKTLTALLVIVMATLSVTAQNKPQRENGRRFSPEQFQTKQREYITDKAKLTQQEAEAFFPIFFELQKEKFNIEQEARSKVIKERGQKLNDEQLKEMLNNNADAKIKTAQLEKEYITKYLQAVPARKLLEIQRAERSFQSHLIKTMTHKEPRSGKDGERKHRKEDFKK